MRERLAGHGAQRKGQGGRGGAQVAILPEEMPEAQQQPHRHAVGGRQEFVGQRAQADEVRVRVVRGAVEPAVGGLEAPQQRVGEIDQQREIGGVVAPLQQFEQGLGEQGMVGEAAGSVAAERRREPALPEGVRADPRDEPCRRQSEIVTAEAPRQRGEAADQQRVRRGQGGFVAIGRGTAAALRGEQPPARLDLRGGLGRRTVERCRHGGDGFCGVEVVATAEGGWQRESVTARERREGPGVHDCAHGGLHPEVIMRLVIDGRRQKPIGEAAIGLKELRERCLCGALGDLAEGGIAGGDGGLGVEPAEDRLVSEPLFKHGHEPGAVGGGREEAALQMVLQAAIGHARECQRGHVECPQVRLRVIRGVGPRREQELDERGGGHLRRRAEAAPRRIKFGLCREARELPGCRSPRRARHRPAEGLQGLDEPCALGGHAGRFLGKETQEARQDGKKRRQPRAAVAREIAADEHRDGVLRRQKRGQRPPAAVPVQQGVAQSEQPVKVGARVTVDQDRHEVLVQ